MSEKTGTEILLGCIGLIFVLILSYILNGIVTLFLWEWFIMSFFGVPALSIAGALGLATFIGFIAKYNPLGSNDDLSLQESLIYAFVSPVTTLIVGYIIHLFV